MMDKEGVYQLLRDNNPFSTNAAGDPREFRFPDVEDIDRQVTDNLKNVIKRKRDYPGDPLAATVLGDTGSGKTHLIGRLVRAGTSGDPLFSFAYIRPFIDPERGFRYLLTEIFNNLNNKSFFDGEYSQIEYICGQIFTHVLTKAAEKKGEKKILATARKCQTDPLTALNLNIVPEVRKKWLLFTKKFLLEELEESSSLYDEFLSVFLQYFFYPERRSAACRWMKGKTIDAGECKILGIPDRAQKSTAALESEAQQILQSLDLLLHHYGDRPLIVFFDQLENLDSMELIQKFGFLIWFLSDTTKKMMPMAFFRGREWDGRVKEIFNEAPRSRLGSNLFVLKGCSQKQSRELVQMRLDMALPEINRPNPLFPFIPDYKKDFDQAINPTVIWPRQVITRTNHLLLNILDIPLKQSTDDEIVEEAFKSRYEEILSNYDQFEPDEGRLTLALELYLNNRPDDASYNVSNLKPSPEKVKYIDLSGQVKRADTSEYEVAFLIDVELHHRAVGAGLQRGIDFLNQNNRTKALFIRDMRCPLPEHPRWPATNQRLTDFLNKGGQTTFLDEKLAARWYALALLKFDIEAGDITRLDGTALSMNHLNHFIVNQMNGDNYPSFALVDEYLGGKATKPEKGDEPVEQEPPFDIPGLSVDTLKNTPVKMLKADLLAIKVSEHAKQEIKVDDLLIKLNEYHDRFSFIRAQDGTLVKLKLEWLHEQA